MSGLWLVLILVISTLNALGAGYAWNDTKARGGFPHLVTWSAAVMGAVGFTILLGWFNLLVLLSTHYITPVQAARGDALLFSLVALPVLGAGLVLTLDAWVAWKRRGYLSDLAVATYDTVAQIDNAFLVARHLGPVLHDAGGLFDGGGSGPDLDVDGEGLGWLLVLLAVAAAFIGGGLVTWGLVKLARDESERRIQLAVAPYRRWK